MTGSSLLLDSPSFVGRAGSSTTCMSSVERLFSEAMDMFAT